MTQGSAEVTAADGVPSVVGRGEADSWFVRQHQRGLDSAVNLLAARRQVLGHIDERGRAAVPGVELVGIGLSNVQRELRQNGVRHSETLCTHPRLAISSESGYRYDRDFVLRGGRMRSLYNTDSVAATAPSEVAMSYLADDVLHRGNFAAPVPVQMIIFDRSVVALEGPEIDGERSVIAVSDSRVLRAAFEYWQTQLALAVPIRQLFDADPLARFTPRQRTVASMLADDMTDAAIAARLDVSLRTVQAEVAAIMRLLDARSRFGAGVQLGRLGFDARQLQRREGRAP